MMDRIPRRGLAALPAALLAASAASAMPPGAVRVGETEAARAFTGMAAQPLGPPQPGVAAFELHRDRVLFVMHEGGLAARIGSYHIRFDSVMQTAFIDVREAPHPDGGAPLRLNLYRQGAQFLVQFQRGGDASGAPIAPVHLTRLPAQAEARLFHQEDAVEAAFRDVSLLGPPELGRYDLHRDGWYLHRATAEAAPVLGRYDLQVARLCLYEPFASEWPSLAFNLWRRRDGGFALQRIARAAEPGAPLPVRVRPYAPPEITALAPATAAEIRAGFAGQTLLFGDGILRPRNAHLLLTGGEYSRRLGFRNDRLRGRYAITDGRIALRELRFNGVPRPDRDLSIFRAEGLFFVAEHEPGEAPTAAAPAALAPATDPP